METTTTTAHGIQITQTRSEGQTTFSGGLHTSLAVQSLLSLLWSVFADGERVSKPIYTREEAERVARGELGLLIGSDIAEIHKLAEEQFPASEFTTTGVLLVVRDAFKMGYIARMEGK
jgi:hypothetical protein